MLKELESLENLIRGGQLPDSPEVLYRYLSIGEKYAKSIKTKQHFVYCRLYQTLIDVISDPLVCMNWRQLCLDNIHKPLQALEHLAITVAQRRVVNRLYVELNVVSHYFFLKLN